MAQNVFFKKGLLANLPESYSAGTFYVTTDERAMYLDIDDSTRIRLGDFIQVAAVANLPTDGASTSALYYCVAENILAKWDGSEWTQINKQPSADEMKVLLGLGSMAYLSEVAEGNLNADLAAKINAASGAQHTHANESVLNGITAAKVEAWDAAEQNAKDYADDLDEAMNARVEALEAIDHEHANKALLDTYTQTEANLADAVAKKHEHANAAELAKIADGDKAKWDAVAADYLDSEDETALKNLIKEAKQAGTDANTNIETYKVANDARVLAVEEDIAEIVDGDNGILAQAKSYSDGKLATARTEISAEIDGDVAVVNKALEDYKSSNDAALAGVKATAEAAATKEYTDAELAKKVDKDTYAADKATFAIAETVNAALDLKANAADVVANDTFEAFKTANTQAIADAKAGAVADVEAKGYAVATDVAATYATKTELGNVDAKFANYVTSASYATDKAAIEKAIEDEGKARSEADAGFEARIADLEANFGDGEGTVEAQIAAAVAAEAEIARAAEKANADDIDALEGRMDTAEGKIATLESDSATHAIKTEVEAALALKADKSALEATDKTLAEVKTTVDNFFADDAAINDTIDTLKEIAAYIATDKEGAADITARVGALEDKVDVEKVSTAIADAVKAEADRADAAYDAKGSAADAQAAAIADAASKYETKGTAQGIVDALKLAETYEPIGAETRAVSAAKAETESQVKALAGEGNTSTVKQNADDIATLYGMFQWGEF